jgi:hypothetical protein
MTRSSAETRRRRAAWAWAMAAMLAVRPGAACAWHGEGHERIVTLALESAKDRLPQVVLQQRAAIEHGSCDPDVLREAPFPQLKDRERPEHFIDLELLGGAALPPMRSEFLWLCLEKKTNPTHAGTLPYAVAEWTERLAVALAEHRKWPRDGAIHAKIGVCAGHLAHYAGDLTQPLHLTVHYDGRAAKDGKSPRSGIHQRVDGLLTLFDFSTRDALKGQELVVYGDIFRGVVAEMDSSRARVDRVYELEPLLMAGEKQPADRPEVRAFAKERLGVAARFLASLLVTAWETSATVNLPVWLQRQDRQER